MSPLDPPKRGTLLVADDGRDPPRAVVFNWVSQNDLTLGMWIVLVTEHRMLPMHCPPKHLRLPTAHDLLVLDWGSE